MDASVGVCGLPLPPHVVLTQRTPGGPRVVTHHCRQMNALRALQDTAPELAELASSIALAFNASAVENPHMARLIIETTCRRILARQPGSHEVMIQHLETFGQLNCLSPEQVTEFTNRLRALA